MAGQSCTIKTHGGALMRAHLLDWLLLFILLGIIGILNYIEPFHRFVGKDMMTDLKYPFKHDTIPMWAVPIYGIMLPCVVFLLYYVKQRNVYDLHHAILGLLYAVLITGVITDAIKDAVGRPRPNFFFRCFPDGIAVFDATTLDVACTNPLKKVLKEGYKSFPSGHTSWSFAGLGYLSCYLSGKVRAFDRNGCVAKLCIVLLPYLAAALVGVTRVDDYWHHWTDVFTGAIIGTVVSTLCYLHFFPYPHDTNGWGPHAYFKLLAEINIGESHASGARNSMTNENWVTPV